MAYSLKVISEENIKAPGGSGLRMEALYDCLRAEKELCWDPQHLDACHVARCRL